MYHLLPMGHVYIEVRIKFVASWWCYLFYKRYNHVTVQHNKLFFNTQPDALIIQIYSAIGFPVSILGFPVSALVSLCLQANAEMVPKFPSCYYRPLM